MSGASPNDRIVRFVVEQHESGERLDRVIALRVPSLGRRRLADSFRQGAVRVDGRKCAKGDPARCGATVEITLPDSDEAIAEPDLPLRVLLETGDVVVVDKPAGQPSGAVRDRTGGTTAGALVARYPEMRNVGFGAREPGLVHRLDTQTSGALIAARSPAAFLALRELLESGRLEKRYLAVVERGRLNRSGTIDAPLRPSAGKRVEVVPAGEAGGHPAHTAYRVVDDHGPWTLVELTAKRAYRHQIRVHLAHLGCPLIGDALYGGPDGGLGPRHALHASYVAGEGAGVTPFTVACPLPDDLVRLLGA